MKRKIRVKNVLDGGHFTGRCWRGLNYVSVQENSSKFNIAPHVDTMRVYEPSFFCSLSKKEANNKQNQ